MRFIPLRDRILVRKLESDKVSKGGIIIPETAQGRDQAWTGEIVAVGAGRCLESGRVLEPTVLVGQKVVVGKYHGTEVKVDEETYHLVPESDILGVVEE